ncbi:SAM-dependent methyltransferase [Acidovorax soli]|uniref:SAM-dependent methyltransferase n=1 Tax=Acidovorax soli TaxID=592050 RepID=A0A7X0U9R6_9BURK|nr:methyltransferase domain-containing protein [Acidovorax soli]MBB6560567.1 SAM-dependent methyltransferase [Acidovorax soli]
MSRLDSLLPLLACPRCGGRLNQHPSQVVCGGCGMGYPLRNGVPVLLPETIEEAGTGEASVDDPVSRHPYSQESLKIIEDHKNGWVLDLGAGGKLQRWDNVVQIDIFRYPMTDVVGSADRLPFRDNSFSAVISQAVFEHLQYPQAAVEEIRRVLKPGGVVKIDTAFLQPEHGYPHHFYNATETGLREWFREFDLRWSGVEPHQHPQWSLSWFMGVYLDRLPAEAAALLRAVPLGDIVDALQRAGTGAALLQDAAIMDALGALPEHHLRTLAAGVSIRAVNPPKTLSSAPMPSLEGASPVVATDLDRKLAAARMDLEHLRSELTTVRESQLLANDQARYMAQYYRLIADAGEEAPLGAGRRAHALFHAKNMVRAVMPPGMWRFLRAGWRSLSGTGAGQAPQPDHPQAAVPFVSVVLQPFDVALLTTTFFSLVRQTYTGWELLLLGHPDQSPAVRRAMEDFARLDSRLTIVPRTDLDGAYPWRGQYRLALQEGTTLSFNALQEMFTLAKMRPDTGAIMADYDAILGRDDVMPPIRCLSAPVPQTNSSFASTASFVLLQAEALRRSGAGGTIDVNYQQVAHIPLVLFHTLQEPSPRAGHPR